MTPGREDGCSRRHHRPARSILIGVVARRLVRDYCVCIAFAIAMLG